MREEDDRDGGREAGREGLVVRVVGKGGPNNPSTSQAAVLSTQDTRRKKARRGGTAREGEKEEHPKGRHPLPLV